MQIIADSNNKFNIEIYFKIKNALGKKVMMIYESLGLEIENELKNIGVDTSIIQSFKDNNIKRKTEDIYLKVISKNYKLYTLKDYNYVINKQLEIEIPFCIIVSKNINLNSKNVLIYYADYFSKSAIYTIKYFSKIINQNNGNVISSYTNENVINLNIINYLSLSDNIDNEILLSNIKYLNFFAILFVDCFIIIEAKYESRVQSLLDLMVECGKDVYVVPSNIYNKNSYFSNYLIKQGAEIILSTNDLKLILKGNIR